MEYLQTEIPERELPGYYKQLEQLFQEQVFELCPIEPEEKNQKAIYIMNDALECFLVFEDSTIHGICETDTEELCHASLVQADQRFGLVVHQGEKNTFSIWFRDIGLEAHCYQYHEIGHFWVKKQEYLRQIVYQLAIMRDKQIYFGEQFCNETELFLIPLMEFGPLQSYYCVDWDKQKYYGSSEAGIWTFLQLTDRAKDSKMRKLVERYQKRPTRWNEWRVAKALSKKDHFPIIDVIYKALREASASYEIRSFGEKQDELLEKCRQYIQVEQKPFLEEHQIQVLEEQPFTIWEAPFSLSFHFISFICKGRRVEQKRATVILEEKDSVQDAYQQFRRQVEKVFSDFV